LNTHRLLLCLTSLLAVACGDDGQSADPTDAGAEAEIRTECALDCDGNGQCTLESGVPSCDCDAGYEFQGLTCVASEESATPPDDFSCPAPGDLSTAAAARFASQGWSYSRNNRSCEAAGGTDIYRFGTNGVLTRHHQSSGAVEGGTLIYGCWTLVSETDETIALAWDHAEGSIFNCGDIGGLQDPPDCSGSVKYDAERNALVIQGSLDNGEVHLLYPVPQDCVWCSDDTDCCPSLSWVEAGGEQLCE